jgi:hypothetical protein
MLKYHVFLDTEDYLIAMWNNEMLQITNNLKTHYMDIRNIGSITTTYSQAPDRDGKFNKDLIDIELHMTDGRLIMLRRVPWKHADALPSIFDFSWRTQQSRAPLDAAPKGMDDMPTEKEPPTTKVPKAKKKRAKNPDVKEEIPPTNDGPDGGVEYELLGGRWKGIYGHNTTKGPADQDIKDRAYEKEKERRGDEDFKEWVGERASGKKSNKSTIVK